MTDRDILDRTTSGAPADRRGWDGGGFERRPRRMAELCYGGGALGGVALIAATALAQDQAAGAATLTPRR